MHLLWFQWIWNCISRTYLGFLWHLLCFNTVLYPQLYGIFCCWIQILIWFSLNLEIFSLFHFLKFNFVRCEWNTLVLAVLWCFWLNRNNLILKRHGSNISFIFHQILHLIIYWTENLTIRQDSATSSIAQTIHSHPTQDNMLSTGDTSPAGGSQPTMTVMASTPGPDNSEI